ncbi:hypothetical protein NBRC10512_003292 [Rhodotorula toruloides]|uniref:RHTO0S24e01046g1_1 n=2 Tax=Rhodotorula toruloides TaxID=5286 RepID=A0A061BMK6_RHOTO|nr:hpp family protein [Rhodotorula toruloides NP11]EMS19332.1 hpp family protein [Rhodotorula toruloides NP11]KAJ8296744.1 Transmembrane protein [Rhodotorula toruloides]CDR49219.1 RHTO0S24e01046g1_1 [Rhodotorula toruloides]
MASQPSAPAYPPALQPAPVSRLTYTRESSLSPSRSPPAAARGYSHSRGRAQRAYWVDGAGVGGQRERSESVGTEGTASEWRSSERSLSRDGSRAPLFRGLHHGKPALGETAATEKPNGLEKVKSKELLERERVAREIEKERIAREKKVRHEWRKHKARWFVRLARHFVGVRGHRGLPTPLIRPLRHLSPANENYLLGFLGSFPSILIACAISSGLSRISSSAFSSTPLTIGSFGATAVLLYAVPEAPLSQPRNLVGGHVISAIVGAVISQLFALSNRFTRDEAVLDNTVAAIGSWHSLTPVSAALSVGLAVFAMQITGTIHPPGGATALIAAYHQQAGPRYTYILDVFLSITAMGVWSCFVGNLGRRRYPVYWWTPLPQPAPDPAPPPPPDEEAASPSADDTSSTTSSTTTTTSSSSPSPSRPAAPPGGTSTFVPPPSLSSRSRSRSQSRPPLDPSHSSHPSEFSAQEDSERRWLGMLGEVDEEALASGDEEARREEERWVEREEMERQRSREKEEREERGRRATRM